MNEKFINENNVYVKLRSHIIPSWRSIAITPSAKQMQTAAILHFSRLIERKENKVLKNIVHNNEALARKLVLQIKERTFVNSTLVNYMWRFEMIELNLFMKEFLLNINRGGSRTTATSKMERFVIIVNGFQLLTIITKRSILDVVAVLVPPLINVDF